MHSYSPGITPRILPWQASFAHGLRLVDGIYLTDSVVPYDQILSALQADDGAALQVQVTQRVTESAEIPFDTPNSGRQ